MALSFIDRLAGQQAQEAHLQLFLERGCGFENVLGLVELQGPELVEIDVDIEIGPDVAQAFANDRLLQDLNRLGEHRNHRRVGADLDIDRGDPTRTIQSRMSTLEAIGTDPGMARNALERRGAAGIFAGRPRFYKGGEIIEAEAPAIHVLNNIMGGVLTNNPLQSLLAIRDAGSLGHPDGFHPPKFVDGRIIERGQEVSERALLAYKARPLNGIWTGAPFLHNGSVPNLYELLLPATERSKTFHVGTWRFDPVRVGYLSEPGPGTVLIDTRLKGNDNAGHEYGTGANGGVGLSDADRWALLEYLKTL